MTPSLAIRVQKVNKGIRTGGRRRTLEELAVLLDDPVAAPAQPISARSEPRPPVRTHLVFSLHPIALSSSPLGSERRLYCIFCFVLNVCGAGGSSHEQALGRRGREGRAHELRLGRVGRDAEDLVAGGGDLVVVVPLRRRRVSTRARGLSLAGRAYEAAGLGRAALRAISWVSEADQGKQCG